MTGLLVLLGAVVLTCAIGVLWRANNGRIRHASPAATNAAADAASVNPTVDSPSTASAVPPAGDRLPASVLPLLDPVPTGDVTLLQLSTTFCTPCRHTRALLADLAEHTDGLRHVDVDVTERQDIASDLRVLRAPTTIAVDEHGRELFRTSGLPDRAKLTAALRPWLSRPELSQPVDPSTAGLETA